MNNIMDYTHAELAGLSLGDVDPVSDQVKVRGKGRKERILPLGRQRPVERDDVVTSVKRPEKGDLQARDIRAANKIGATFRFLPLSGFVVQSAVQNINPAVSG